MGRSLSAPADDASAIGCQQRGDCKSTSILEQNGRTGLEWRGGRGRGGGNLFRDCCSSLLLDWGAIFITHGADVLGNSLVGLWTGELQTNLTTRLFGAEVHQGL